MKKFGKILLIILITLVLIFFAGFYLWNKFSQNMLSQTTSIEDGITEETPVGTWAKITSPEIITAHGEKSPVYYRKGTENKLVIYFFGGGVSIDEYTDANGFYNDKPLDGGGELLLNIFALGYPGKENPFNNWNVLMVPYVNGDFHLGNGTAEYTNLEGNRAIIHHNGYKNFDEAMKIVQPYIGTPEKLLIAGSSAGAFGVSMLTNDIVSRFPDTKNVTAVIDGAVLINENWPEIAKNKWKAPKHIYEQFITDNLVLDGIKSISQKNSEVKILFDTTTRDTSLGEVQHYIDHKEKKISLETGDRIQKITSEMVKNILQIS